MSYVHRCKFCDGDYPCDTLEQVSEDQWRCQCAFTDECPGCHTFGACEKCGNQPAGSDENESLCSACGQTWLENYEPPDQDLSGPTYREQSAHWAEQRQKERNK